MKVTALRDHCAAELRRSFTVDSVVQVAVLADKISHRRLLDDCLAFASCDENRCAWPGVLCVVSMLFMLQSCQQSQGRLAMVALVHIRVLHCVCISPWTGILYVLEVSAEAPARVDTAQFELCLFDNSEEEDRQISQQG